MHRYCNDKLVYLTKYRSRGASRYFLNHKLVKACLFLFHRLKICKKVNEGKFCSSLNYRIGIKTQTLCHYTTTLLLTEDFHSSDRPEWFLPRFGLSELQKFPSQVSPIYCQRPGASLLHLHSNSLKGNKLNFCWDQQELHHSTN